MALAMIGFVVFSSLGWVTTVEGSLLAAEQYL